MRYKRHEIAFELAQFLFAGEGAEQFLFGLLTLSNVQRVYQHVRLTANFDDVRGKEHGVEAAARVLDRDLTLADDAIALQVVPESGPVCWVGPDAQFGGTFPNDFGPRKVEPVQKSIVHFDEFAVTHARNARANRAAVEGTAEACLAL